MQGCRSSQSRPPDGRLIRRYLATSMSPGASPRHVCGRGCAGSSMVRPIPSRLNIHRSQTSWDGPRRTGCATRMRRTHWSTVQRSQPCVITCATHRFRRPQSISTMTRYSARIGSRGSSHDGRPHSGMCARVQSPAWRGFCPGFSIYGYWALLAKMGLRKTAKNRNLEAVRIRVLPRFC